MSPGGARAAAEQIRATGWNSPDEPVVFWPILLCAAFGVIIYYYPGKVNSITSTLGLNWLYGVVWGDRSGWTRAAIAFLVLFFAVKNAYRVEQCVEAWGSWITTGTFSKAREPTLTKGLDPNAPLVPTFATIIILCILMANRGVLTESSLYAVVWRDRSAGMRWLLAIGALFALATCADPIVLFLQNFNAYITQGHWPLTQAGPHQTAHPQESLCVSTADKGSKFIKTRIQCSKGL